MVYHVDDIEVLGAEEPVHQVQELSMGSRSLSSRYLGLRELSTGSISLSSRCLGLRNLSMGSKSLSSRCLGLRILSMVSISWINAHLQVFDIWISVYLADFS